MTIGVLAAAGGVAYVVWLVLAIGAVLGERRTPTSTLAWILAFATAPLLSGVLYVVFGPRRVERRRARYDRGRRAVEDGVAAWLAKVPPRPPLAGAAGTLAGVAERCGQPAPLHATELTLLPDGDATLAAIEADVDAARHHVHVEYYIWDDDVVGTRIRDALVRAAARGVEVRLVYDDLGSPAGSEFWRPIRDAGGKARAFNPVRVSLKHVGLANFRTHRKIVVIDGTTGYCGGNNLHDPVSAARRGDAAWRDLHVRLTGDAVRPLHRIFLDDWAFTGGRFRVDGETMCAYFPACASAGPAVQALASGPDDERVAIYTWLLTALAVAERRVWIQTPYLIPDDPFEEALRVAVLRGVDVRILVPLVGDSYLVAAASRTWCESLCRAGVVIHEYTPRFLHAKAVVVDEAAALVGTANMDNRSFRLNFEVMLAVYEPGFVRQLAERFRVDERESRPFLGRGRGARLTSVLEAVARLFSPIL